MEEKRFILELNEKQLRLVNEALEEYFRIRMGQWNGLADSLASKNIDLSPNNPSHDKIFSNFISLRNCVCIVLESVGMMVWGQPQYNPKSEEQLIAEDIWRVIRYRLFLESGSKDTWRVDSYPPIFVSGESAPKCEIVKK